MEVAEDGQADGLAFFRMKLGGEEVTTPDRGRESFAVLGPGGDDGIVGGPGEEAVNEIGVTAVGDVGEEGAIGLGEMQLVPADVGDFEVVLGGEADHRSGEDAQAGFPGLKLLTSFEEGLVSDANAEEWGASGEAFPERFQEFLVAQGMQTIVKGAHAGEDDALGMGKIGASGGDADLGADLEQGLMDAAQIAGSVIDERKHGGSLA